MMHLVRKLQPDYYRARFFTEWQFYGLSPRLWCLLHSTFHQFSYTRHAVR
jgi:hypothetical protein|tara:strand:+ start:582 stop:731 length:150 start_codon:yes stop_codon:yes gene_type:complete